MRLRPFARQAASTKTRGVHRQQESGVALPEIPRGNRARGLVGPQTADDRRSWSEQKLFEISGEREVRHGGHHERTFRPAQGWRPVAGRQPPESCV